MGTRGDTEEAGPYVVGRRGGTIPRLEGPALFKECAWFGKSPKSKELLDSIRSSKILDEAALQELLQGRRAYYEEGVGEERIIPKKNRKNWRKDLITLYDILLLVVVGAEEDCWENWINVEGEKSHLEGLDAVKERWEESLYSNSDMFQSLMNQIFENDDIMLKYYMHNAKFKKLLRGHGVMLIISMEIQRDYLFYPILKTIKDSWKAEDCQGPLDESHENLLNELIAMFKNHVLGENGSRKRYKALITWLLSQTHAGFSGSRVWISDNLEYFGPFQLLFQRIILEDTDMLLEDDKDEFNRLEVPKSKEGILKGVKLGTLKFSSVLAMASAANDHVVVKSILESGAKFEKSAECNNEWKASWKKTWASALWNAAYNGHEKVVKELFERSEFYSEVDQYFGASMQPPLHVAVYKGHYLVVDAFCSAAEATKSKANISCHDEDELLHQTPVEVAMKISEQCPDDHKRNNSRILRSLLRRPEVKQFIAQQKESQVNSVNAIMVGATLIAGATYGGWLQPPLGYSTDYQFPEPLPAPPGTFESYMSIGGHATVQVFLVFNSLSFFLAIAGIVAGGSCFLKGSEQKNLFSTLRALQSRLIWATRLFIASVICILVAFASSGIAILPPVKRYQWSMYITIIFGGGLCTYALSKMLQYPVSRFLRRIFGKSRENHKWRLNKLNSTASDGPLISGKTRGLEDGEDWSKFSPKPL